MFQIFQNTFSTKTADQINKEWPTDKRFWGNYFACLYTVSVVFFSYVGLFEYLLGDRPVANGFYAEKVSIKKWGN